MEPDLAHFVHRPVDPLAPMQSVALDSPVKQASDGSPPRSNSVET